MNFLQQTLNLCKMYGIEPSRSKGQNFLVNEEIYDLIISTADLKSTDVVLEVGPGLGFLTFKMADKVKKVLAVELDDKLAEFLKISLISQKRENVKIFNNDVLKIKGEKISQIGKYKIVANLPYNITSIFLRKFLSLNNKPELMVLLLQKEVVDRIIAKPPKMSLLSISVQFYAEVFKIAEVSAKNFHPAPKIDSAIIKIVPKKEQIFKDYQAEKQFFKLLRQGFSAKRKMLKNNLSISYNLKPEEIAEIFSSLGINPQCRAGDLSLKNWLEIFKKLN